jgi:hypothetical protein
MTPGPIGAYSATFRAAAGPGSAREAVIPVTVNP